MVRGGPNEEQGIPGNDGLQRAGLPTRQSKRIYDNRPEAQQTGGRSAFPNGRGYSGLHKGRGPGTPSGRGLGGPGNAPSKRLMEKEDSEDELDRARED